MHPFTDDLSVIKQKLHRFIHHSCHTLNAVHRIWPALTPTTQATIYADQLHSEAIVKLQSLYTCISLMQPMYDASRSHRLPVLNINSHLSNMFSENSNWMQTTVRTTTVHDGHVIYGILQYFKVDTDHSSRSFLIDDSF